MSIVSLISKVSKGYKFKNPKNSLEVKPVITWVCDDGRVEDEKFHNILKPYGYNWCSSIITNRVDNPKWPTHMNLEQLKRLQSEGVEMISHTTDHLRLKTLDTDTIREQLMESKLWLEKNGFPSEHIMYPFGSISEDVLRETRKIYKSGAIGSVALNRIPLVTYKVERVPFGSYIGISDSPDGFSPGTFGYYKWWIDECVRRKTWLIFMVHPADNHMNVKDPSQWDRLKEILDYIRDENILVETYGQAYERFKNIQDIGDHNIGITSTPYSVIDCNGVSKRGCRKMIIN